MIHILSDTSTMYTPEQGEQFGATIIPLHVTVNDRSYRDLEDISDDMLLDMIAEKHIPKTSQPALGEKIDAYDQLSETGEVLDIAMSSGLSGTYQSALLAKGQCAHPDRVHVFDSRTLCGPHRIMLDTAVSMAKQGKSIQEILAVLEKARDTEVSYLVPFDFGFLVRGGRLNSMAGALGGLLKLIPGIDGDYLRYFLERNDAIIIESFGVGGLPMGERYHFGEAIEWGINQGKTIVMTTQVPNEGSDMTIYQVGHHLKQYDSVLEAYDMTTEAVVTKLMWILGQTREPAGIRRLFYTTVAQDILYNESR